MWFWLRIQLLNLGLLPKSVLNLQIQIQIQIQIQGRGRRPTPENLELPPKPALRGAYRRAS